MSYGAYTCPVCGGRGLVPDGFYNLGGVLTTTSSEQCRSCGGKGYILFGATDEPVSIHLDRNAGKSD